MLRDDVLLLLTEAEGYLSGEEMREKLGVSRAAVSQAVRALRADGYDIDAYFWTKHPHLLFPLQS